MNFIKKYLTKTIASQLRKPSGVLATKVGNKMNQTNGFLYDFTISTMKPGDNETILEIGFGNGRFFEKIFSSGRNLLLSGLDFSPEMVKEAANNNQDAVAAGNLTLKLGSSDKIPFPDNSFDKLFCINVIYFWEKPADHVKEIYRVLKPGGKFYTSIRKKESLGQLPFSKYGFTIYTEAEWIDILQANQFRFLQTRITENEPDAELDGKRYQMESLCIVADKKV